MRLTSEEIFLIGIKKLIQNLLIENINYVNEHYSYNDLFKLLTDTKERAKYIIEEIQRTEHLIKE